MAAPLGDDGQGWPVTSFLGQLSPAARTEILRLGTRKTFSAREIVLQEGDASGFAVLLLSGWFKVIASLELDREALLAIRYRGDLVGELGAVDGEPRIATVKALGPGTGRRIGRREYLAFLEAHPDAERAASRAVVDKLRSATRRRVEFATCSAPTRVARVLVELVLAYGRPTADGVVLDLSLTQPELAGLIGATEVTIQRILASMRKDGIVETGYRRLTVLDQDRLAEFAEG